MDNAPSRPHLAGAGAYGVATLCVAIAWAGRWALDPIWGNRFPYVPAFVAVFVVIQLAETGPALFAMGLSLVVSDWCFVLPRHSLMISELSDRTNSVLFILISLLMLYFTLRTRRALARERATQRDLQHHVQALGQSRAHLQELFEQLRRQEEHFRSLIERSSDVVSIIDDEAIIQYLGPSIKQVLGYEPSDMLGHQAFEFVDPQDHSAVKDVLARRGQQDSAETRLELRHRHKNGSWRILECCGRQLSGEKHGGKRQFVVNLRDITERRQLEEAHTRLAALVESSGDAIISKALDGSILSWNAAAEELYGYTAEEVLGRSVQLIIPPERAEEMTPLLERVRSGEHIDHFETVRQTKAGRRVEVSLSISPIHAKNGEIIAASTIARDVTERRKQERERAHLVEQLRTALAEVKTLSGLLPICAHCKKIRDDSGYWNQIEYYIRQHSNAKFTHGICPDCSRKFYPELFAEK